MTDVKMVSCRFLDVNVTKGVSASFRDRLLRADAALRARFTAEKPGIPWAQWHGVRTVRGYYDGGPHKYGEAIDVNYGTNGYGISLTGATFGGEWSGRDMDVRLPAFNAIRQAVIAKDGTAQGLDLSAWRKGEKTADVFRRVNHASDCVRSYFAPYFRSGTAFYNVKRKPSATYLTDPISAFAKMAQTGELLVSLDTVPIEVLRDYEAIRIPLVIGNPERRPGETRNPANGLIDLKQHVVEALCDDAGLRWGQMFGKRESGDYMHFDSSNRIPA